MANFVQFFSSGPSREEPQGRPEEYEQPEWAGPSDGELGECVPLSVIVARSERAVVAIKHATAYSRGLIFDFVSAARGLPERDTNRLFHEQHVLDAEAEPPAGFLRIGIELADGTRISNLGNPHRHLWRPDAVPQGPLLVPSSGGGGSAGAGRVTMSPGYWLWPLPPPGPLRVFVEWPALDIPLSSAELDSEPLLDAAARSQLLWPA